MDMIPVKGYEGKYSVSPIGEVYTHKRKRNLIGYKDKDGYPIVALTADGLTKGKKVHRLVAQAFIPNPFNLPQVNHLNATKTDNRVENLEWCTWKQNQQHCIDNKLHRRGERHGMAKLTWTQVLEIRKDYGTTEHHRATPLARKYGVTRNAIYQITSNKLWKQHA